MSLPPAVVIHGLRHAEMALAPGRPVTLLSAPGAAGFAGPGWWRALVQRALDGRVVPDILDCADAPGRALEALSLGCGVLVLLPCHGWSGVAERAAAQGSTLLAQRPAALDLADPAAAWRWLRGGHP